jgi:CRISPR type I-E-associated protein CasB/Cse2
VDLNRNFVRKAFLTVGFALASDPYLQHQQNLSLGKVFRLMKQSDSSNSAIQEQQLKRLLSADSSLELNVLLRFVLSRFRSFKKQSKRIENINYTQLLKDILNFDYELKREEIKCRWAKEFYQGFNIQTKEENVS